MDDSLRRKRLKEYQKLKIVPKNLSFQKFTKVLELFGFELDRARGSHHIFVRRKQGRQDKHTTNETPKSKTLPDKTILNNGR